MELGLGCMRPSPEIFSKLVDYAMENGIKYFVSCQFYQHGKCEDIVAEALKKYPRDSYMLCGKINFPYKNKPIEEVFNESLNNCKTDYFDYYLIQALDRNSLKFLTQDNIDFLNEMRRQGKIKKLGFSFHDTPDIFELIIQKNNWDCCQLQINYYDWNFGVAKDLYNIAVKYNLPIIVMGGLKGGILADKMPKPIIDSYSKSCPNDSLASLGYRFLKSLPQINIILSGATSISMLENNLQDINNNLLLSENDEKVINRIISLFYKFNAIQCTDCKYCESVCPKNIKLGDFFKLYNKIIFNPNDLESRNQYYKILKDKQHSFLSCIHCKKCESKCPQHLPIQHLISYNLFPMRL